MLSAPGGHLQSLVVWPPQAVLSMAVCLLPGQQMLVTLKCHLHLKVRLIRPGPPGGTSLFDGQLISDLITGVVSRLICRSCPHSRGEGSRGRALKDAGNLGPV